MTVYSGERAMCYTDASHQQCIDIQTECGTETIMLQTCPETFECPN